MKTNVGPIAFLAILLLAVSLIAVGPLLVIWSLNTLFPALAIPYTVWTWAATVIIGAVLSPTVRVTKK